MDKRKINLDARLKMLDEGNGTMDGYGSVFGAVDRVKERTQPGAFAKCLPAFVKDGFIAWGHDWTAPVATILEAKEDDYGLYLKAEFHGTTSGQEARQWVKERLDRGKSAGLSIGYREIQTKQADDGVTDLTELDLYEVSIVTVPCLPSAQLYSAKSGSLAGLTLEEHSETVLAAVQELDARYKDLADLREKAGRVLSDANRARLRQHVTALGACMSDLEDLLASTEPKADADAIDAVAARYAALVSRVAALPV